MGTCLPTLNFLTNSADYTDYRPAINSAGDTVIFERTPATGLTVLQMIDDFSSPTPVPFLGTSPPPPASQTRPDWCWQTNAVAFNGGPSNNEISGVWQVAGDGSNLQSINNTAGCAYPRWNLDGTMFVTENNGSQASPVPCNSIFDTSGNLQKPVSIDGADSAGTLLFGGMPAVGPNDLPQIVFAGQPALVGWGKSTSKKPVYNQNMNYILLNTKAADGTFSSAPMESGANVKSYVAACQGRAPAWSPDGKTIAFESNRLGGGYAIYLCNLASGTITQVTDPSLGGQHAKFFSDGSKLILCINHPGGTPGTMGIAWVDISGLLS